MSTQANPPAEIDPLVFSHTLLKLRTAILASIPSDFECIIAVTRHDFLLGFSLQGVCASHQELRSVTSRGLLELFVAVDWDQERVRAEELRKESQL